LSESYPADSHTPKKRERETNHTEINESHKDKRLKEDNSPKYVTQAGKEISETAKMMSATDWEP
jgi:hypothetical protein